MVIRKTHKQFLDELYSIHGDEYQLLDNYVNSRTKILIRHNKCGYEWDVLPTSILGRRGCPKCSINACKTQETFSKEVFDRVGNDYTVLGDYINNKTKILMRHNICGYEWKVEPGAFLKRNRCPRCGHRLKKDTQQFKDEVYTIVGDEYGVIGEYKTNAEPVLMKHNVCGHEWEVYPGNFLKKENRCPKCALKLRTRSNEEFIEEIYALVGDEYSLLSEYSNINNPVTIRHNTCGYIWDIVANSFLNSGNRCPKCGGKIQKDTQYFTDEVYDLVGDEYAVLGQYTKSSEKITMKHNICGTIWDVIPSNFLRGSKCPTCSRHALKSTEKFRKEVFNLVGDEFDVLGQYESSKNPILMRHNDCGNEWNTYPNNFLKRPNCPICTIREGAEKKSKDHGEFIKEMLELVGDEYSLLSKYTRSSNKILVRHNKCGYEWMVRAGSLLYGSRCPKCTREDAIEKSRKTHEEFVKEVFDLVGNEYQVLGIYQTSGTKILMRHSECGLEWNVRPGQFLYLATRCPICQGSKGEVKIKKLLDMWSVPYEVQFTFPDCKYKGLLKFDFVIKENKQVICAIEYNGKQHYEPIEYFGGEQGFKVSCIRDKIKARYCLKSNIPLIIIPYWEYDRIHEVLYSELSKLNLGILQ